MIKTTEQKTVFEAAIEKMYGNFGRVLSPGAKAAAYEQLQHLPESFIVWAKGEVYKLDAFPGNFPRFILTVLYPKWQSQQGQQQSEQASFKRCPDCDLEMPGFITAWRHDQNRKVFRCLCNNRPEFEFMPKLSREGISRLIDNTSPTRAHYFVPPPGHKLTRVENIEFPPTYGLSALSPDVEASFKVHRINPDARKR